MDNREALLHCALDRFAARGYDGVGVQEIVECAGITKPTLYHYFGSKSGLLAALLESFHAPFIARLETACAYQGDLPLTLERIARCFFQFARDHPVYYRMHLGFSVAPPESEASRAVASWNERQRALIEAVFTQAVVQHGNMRGRQRLFAATLIGMINTCVGLWLNGTAPLDDDLLRSALRQFQHGIYS